MSWIVANMPEILKRDLDELKTIEKLSEAITATAERLAEVKQRTSTDSQTGGHDPALDEEESYLGERLGDLVTKLSKEFDKEHALAKKYHNFIRK